MVLLLTSALAFYKPNGSLSKTDESIHAKVVQEMSYSGDLFRQTYEGQPYYRKPPLQMWLSLIPVRIFDGATFSYRLVNGIAALGLTALVVLLGQLLLGSWWIGVFAALFLNSSTIIVNEAHGFRRATQDPLMLLLGTASITLLWAWLSRSSVRTGRANLTLPLLAGVLSGAACLTKNVIGYVPASLFFLFCFFLLATKRLPFRHLLAGILAFGLSALCVPLLFFLPHFILSPGSFQAYFVDEIYNRATVGMHNVGNHFYYFNVLFVRSMLFPPWLVALALVWGSYRALVNRSLAHIFLMIWAVLPVLMFSALSSRLFWYIALTFPAFALLAGDLIATCFKEARSRAVSPSGRARLSAAALASLAILAISSLVPNYLYLFRQIELAAERIPLDLAVDEIKMATSHFSTPPIVEVYEPPFSRNRLFASRMEKFYLDRLRANTIWINQTSPQKADFAVVPLDAVVETVQAKGALPVSYLPLPPYHSRKTPLIILSFNSNFRSDKFLPASREIELLSLPADRLNGITAIEFQSTGRVPVVTGPSAQITLDNNSLYCRLGARVSTTLKNLSPKQSATIEFSANNIKLSAVELAPAQAETLEFLAPPNAWRCRQSTLQVKARATNDFESAPQIALNKIGLALPNLK